MNFINYLLYWTLKLQCLHKNSAICTLFRIAHFGSYLYYTPVVHVAYHPGTCPLSILICSTLHPLLLSDHIFVCFMTHIFRRLPDCLTAASETGLETGRSGFESRYGTEILLSSKIFRESQGPTQYRMVTLTMKRPVRCIWPLTATMFWRYKSVELCFCSPYMPSGTGTDPSSLLPQKQNY
jgi:hypothetical protein